jgi:hypothetical protein
LKPSSGRGFACQTGNLLASGNATVQVAIAHANGENYAFALASMAAVAEQMLFYGAPSGPARFGKPHHCQVRRA